MDNSVNDFGNGNKYPLIRLSSINVAQRPDGEDFDPLFFNPRSESSFTESSLSDLMHSIRTDELLEPLVVRELEDGSLQLLAGERRLRSIQMIVEKDLSCYSSDLVESGEFEVGETVLYMDQFAKVIGQEMDEVSIELFDSNDSPIGDIVNVDAFELKRTMKASESYEFVPCKVLKDCYDERALRINMAENGQSEPLTLAEEIAVVERLSHLPQKEIAYMLSAHASWVSQTANFRSQLPKEAFEKLLAGEMARGVATKIMSYNPEDREALYHSAIKAEEEATDAKKRKIQLDINQFEDEMDILSDMGQEDKALVAQNKMDAAKEKQQQIEDNKGNLTSGHVESGASRANIKPKKKKMLSSKNVMEMIEELDNMMLQEVADPISGYDIDSNHLKLVKHTLMSVVSGESDPLHSIRSFNGWEVPEEVCTQDEGFTADDWNAEPVDHVVDEENVQPDYDPIIGGDDFDYGDV